MRLAVVLPLALLASSAAMAQPAIEIGPGGVRVDPGLRRAPTEERIVRDEGPCRITTIRRIDEFGRRTTRRVRECDEDEDE